MGSRLECMQVIDVMRIFSIVNTTPSRVALCALLAMGFGCSSSEDKGPTREAVLGQLSQGVMLPSVEALGQQVVTMQASAETLCTSGGATAKGLADARASWRAAFLALTTARTYNQGPTRDRRLTLNVAFWPLDEAAITAALEPSEDAPALDATWVNAQGADVAGVHAIERLLFEPQLDAEVAAAFDPQGRRCAMLKAVIEDARQRVDHVVSAWQGDDGYARALETAGAGSAVFDSTKMALDAVINAWIGQLEMIINADLGAPLGVGAGGAPQPEAVRGYRAQAGADALLAQAHAMKALYTRGGDASLRAFLAARSPALAQRVSDQLDALIAAIEGWPQPLTTLVTADTARVEAAQEHARTLLRTIKAEVASVLGVTIAFTDNDGD